MFLAHISRILDRFLNDIMDVLVKSVRLARSRDDEPRPYGFRADNSNIIRVRFEGV